MGGNKKRERERETEKLPGSSPNAAGGFIAVDTVWATPRFPSWFLPKLSLGTGFSHRSRDGTKWLDLGEQTW